MNRTMAYEAHLEQIVDLRNQAYDADTLARSFGDLAGEVQALPTKGAISDVAVQEMVNYARSQTERYRLLAQNKRERADRMEKDGLP